MPRPSSVTHSTTRVLSVRTDSVIVLHSACSKALIIILDTALDNPCLLTKRLAMLIDRVFEHHAVSLAIGFMKRVQLGANVAQVGDARRFGNVIEPCVIAYFGQVGYDARGVLLDMLKALTCSPSFSLSISVPISATELDSGFFISCDTKRNRLSRSATMALISSVCRSTSKCKFFR